jgi:hypothetical protein
MFANFYNYFHVVPFTTVEIDKTADFQGRGTGYLPARWSKDIKIEFTGRRPINLRGSGKRQLMVGYLGRKTGSHPAGQPELGLMKEFLKGDAIF